MRYTRGIPAAEVSKAVTVVSDAEIEGRNEFSVADALRMVAGVTIQQLGGPGTFTSIKIRGLREQDTSVLIDGVDIAFSISTAFKAPLRQSLLAIRFFRPDPAADYGSPGHDTLNR